MTSFKSNSKPQTTPTLSQSQSIQSKSAFNLHSILQSAQLSILKFRDCYTDYKYQFKKSQSYKSFLQFRDSASNNFFNPIAQIYQRFPSKVTQWKFSVIGGYTQNQRLMIVNIFAFLTAIRAFKRFEVSHTVGTSLRCIKNTSIVYLISGLLIAPQIFNPIMTNVQ